MRIHAGILMLALCAGAAAQTSPAPRFGGWAFSALFDGYIDHNPNAPAMDLNQLQNFDLHTGTPRLSFAKITIDKSDKVFGIHLDLGLGETLRSIHSSDPAAIAHKALRDIEQAYLIFKPVGAHGTEIDFGQFVATQGAEVMESSSNWNYTHSLIYVYAVPYYHFGLKTTTPVTKELTLGFQLVNAWNNIWGNNDLRTIGLNLAYTKPKYTYTLNYETGPNQLIPGGRRNSIDTTMLMTPTAKFSAYINADWNHENLTAGQYAQWYGLAGAARYQISKHFAAAGRMEFFTDAQGHVTGTAQSVREATGTAEYKYNDHFITRLDLRKDISDRPFFNRGNTQPPGKSMTTVTLGIVALLGPYK